MEFIDEYKYKNLSGIYRIIQKSSGKSYIGQTKMTFIKRYWHHNWKLNDNSHDNRHLQNAWNKYGEDDFNFEIIHILDKHVDMNELEIGYIKQYNSYSKGFNLTTGGEGKKDCPTSDRAKRIIGQKNRIHNLGKKASEETKTKMRASSPRRKLTQDQVEKLRQSRIGSKHTEESKQKMSESHLGVGLINEYQAKTIKEKFINGSKIIDISNSMNINYPIVKSILQEKSWNHVFVEGWDEFIDDYNKNIKKKTLDPSKVREIRDLLSQNYTANKIAEMCDVGCSVVYGIKQNRTYRDII